MAHKYDHRVLVEQIGSEDRAVEQIEASHSKDLTNIKSRRRVSVPVLKIRGYARISYTGTRNMGKSTFRMLFRTRDMCTTAK